MRLAIFVNYTLAEHTAHKRIPVTAGVELTTTMCEAQQARVPAWGQGLCTKLKNHKVLV